MQLFLMKYIYYYQTMNSNNNKPARCSEPVSEVQKFLFFGTKRVV